MAYQAPANTYDVVIVGGGHSVCVTERGAQPAAIAEAGGRLV